MQLQNNIWETGSNILNSVEYHFFPNTLCRSSNYVTSNLEANLQHKAGGSVVKKEMVFTDLTHVKSLFESTSNY